MISNDILTQQSNISKIRPNLFQLPTGHVIGFGAILAPGSLGYCFTCNEPDCEHVRAVNEVDLNGTDMMSYESDAKKKKSEYNRRYRESNREKIAEINRRYREANREKIAEYNRRYSEANRDQIAERNRQYNEANRDEIAERNRQWRRSNPQSARRYREANIENRREQDRQYKKANPASPEKIAEINRRYREANREKRREQTHRYSEANPAKISASNRRRRVRMVGSSGSHTEAEWQALCSYYMDQCLCCGEVPDLLTRDHVVPLIKGGSDNIENIQPLCAGCNSRKGTKTIDYRTSQVDEDWLAGGHSVESNAIPTAWWTVANGVDDFSIDRKTGKVTL